MRPAREDGFTLIELLVASTILVVVVATISLALGLFFSATGETTDRLAESPEVQVASVYVTRDAQSAEFADTNVATAKTCAAGTWTGFTHLVSFAWRDPGTTTEVVGQDRAVVVSYVVATSASNPSQKELRRYACTKQFTVPGEAFPSTIATAADTQTLIALVDPSTPAPAASVTTTRVTMSMGVCTAKTGAAQCKNGVSLPFDLSVTRRVV